MPSDPIVPPANDKPLFTPGPLTTSRTVKQAMLRDLGSRDHEFIAIVADIRRRLLQIAGVKQDFTAIPIQGSGTFGIEAILSSTIPRDGKLLIAVNGAYGERITAMASVLSIDHTALRVPENQPIDPALIAETLQQDASITHVAVVHCETTTGLINPVEPIGRAVRNAGRINIVDAMSSFGAVPLNLENACADYLVSSANKCIEGVPGFAFVLARRSALEKTKGYARCLSLDLYAQWQGLESTGQFRFTPPTHALLAFHQALLELEQEGGVAGRAARYRANYAALIAGMRAIGFEEYLDPALQGYIITSFRYPDHPNFAFDDFYNRLNEKGFVIYPGKLTHDNCFRIGTIGRIFPPDVKNLLAAISRVLSEMNFELHPSPVS